MTTLLALALLAAGLAMLIGARPTAYKIVLAVILGLSVGRCVACWLASAWMQAGGSASSFDWLWLSIALALTALGGIAWKTRAFRARRLEEQCRRHMHPRQPAPLPPPSRSDDRWSS